MRHLCGALLAVPFAVAVAQGVLAQEIADRIWAGGPVLTMNDAAMRAEALAAKDGRILAVGTAAEVMAHRGPGTEVIDLGGRALLPGFFDAHGHVVMGGLQALSANLLAPPDGEVTDIPALLATLEAWVAANGAAIRAANLIVGFGYDNATLAEHRHPTRTELDRISTETPVLIVHQSAHLGVANSKALEVAGIGRDTPDPPGGVIRRGPDGLPDGVLEENAFNQVAAKLLSQIGLAGAKTMARAGAELWARYGYTTAEEGRTVPPIVQVLKQVGAEGGLPIDVVAYVDVLVDRDFVQANASRTYRDRVRVGGAKLTIDGSPQGFTAWRDRPYYAPVGDYPPGYVGYPSATNPQAVDAVDWAFANRVQLLTHSNGEAATDLLLAAVDAATKKHGPADRRPVLIHGQFLRADQVGAIDRLGVFPSLFPMHTFYWGDWHRDHTVGPALADDISPTGWVTARRMRFSTHHDAPVAFPDSMRVLDATVTRRSRSGDIIGPAQRVDVLTALKAMTIWPAFAHFEDEAKGSLEPGKLADLVVLSADPTAVDHESLDRLQVVETIKEGATVYALDTTQIRKGQLMLPPGGPGERAFARTLARAAVVHDLARAGRPAHPGLVRLALALPHDGSCIAATLMTAIAASPDVAALR